MATVSYYGCPGISRNHHPIGHTGLISPCVPYASSHSRLRKLLFTSNAIKGDYHPFNTAISSHKHPMSSPDSPFTFGMRVGLLLLVATSAVSAFAIISLLSYIAVCDACHQDDSSIELCFQKYSAVSIIPGSPRRWSIGGPAEVYFLNQLAWDLIQAAGESYDSGN